MQQGNIDIIDKVQQGTEQMVLMNSQLQVLSGTVTTLVSVVTAKKKPRVRLHKRPMALRSALTASTVQELFADFTSATVVGQRNLLAIAATRAMGARVNEIREMTFGEIDDLVVSRHCVIYNSKCNALEEKAISEFFAEQIKRLSDQSQSVLKPALDVDEIPRDMYAFSSFNALDSLPLSPSDFISSVNKVLSDFSAKHNKTTLGPKLRLTSHSCRAGFIAELISNKAPLELVRKLVGHKDTRSTIIYDRTVMSAQDRIEMVDQFTTPVQPSKTTDD